jgi:tRNA-dihydrouridine synthase
MRHVLFVCAALCAAAALARYDVDGLMVGRAAIQRPWVFREVCQARSETDLLGLIEDFYGREVPER